MASSRGILVKGGEVIENLSRIDHVVFDKTGTITEGKPSLREIIRIDREAEETYPLKVAASLENLSEHSLGQAIRDAWKHDLLNVSDFRAVPGRGIEGRVDGRRCLIGNRAFLAENDIDSLPDNSPITSLDELTDPFERSGDTVIYLGWSDAVRAVFVVSDCLREEAKDAVNAIAERNINITVISGDNSITTAAVSGAAGIRNAEAGMSPAGKRDYIHALQAGGSHILMAGDGINDAPALTEASVGMAMGRGTDIAMESADAVLIRNDLTAIPYFIGLSARTYRIIKQNIFWAFFYNIVAVPLAVSGALHPIVAAGAMAASSLFVVINSLRIRKKDKF
jgi:Cu2+-exporting ATPase